MLVNCELNQTVNDGYLIHQTNLDSYHTTCCIWTFNQKGPKQARAGIVYPSYTPCNNKSSTFFRRFMIWLEEIEGKEKREGWISLVGGEDTIEDAWRQQTSLAESTCHQHACAVILSFFFSRLCLHECWFLSRLVVWFGYFILFSTWLAHYL